MPSELILLVKTIINSSSRPALPYSRPKWSKSVLYFSTKRLKNHTFNAAHTYTAYIGEYRASVILKASISYLARNVFCDAPLSELL